MDTNKWLEDDYYHLLGVHQSSTNEEINKAYRLKAKQVHPDAYPLNSIERDLAEKNFKNLILARDTLLDPDKREEYNNQLLIQQQCYLSYISTNYSLPLSKETIKKPTFKDVLKEEMEKEIEHDYIQEENVYTPNKFYNDPDYMTNEEKAKYYKKESAKKFYAMAMQYIGYKDYRRALTYFKSAKYLDPNISIPRHYFP